MAWFRQSLWSDAPMLYLAAAARRPGRLEEHWNWPAGSTVAVSAYTNADEVTLTLNDQPLGARPLAGAVDGVLNWDVPYQPGVLKAVATTKGKPVAGFTLTTAGDAARIELAPDVTRVTANGEDVVHLEYRIVDKNGVRVPNANAEVTFAVDGPARLLGIGNGDLNDVTSGQGPAHRAYQGRGLAILQSTSAPGTITLRASAPGLEPAAATVTAVARRQ
jgi:beta-galactosidase